MLAIASCGSSGTSAGTQRHAISGNVVVFADTAMEGAFDAISPKFQSKTVTVSYPAATVRGARNPAGARVFITYVLSPAGQKVLAKYGFQPPGG